MTRAVIPEYFHQSTLARHDTSCISSDMDVEKQRHSAIPAIFDAGTELRTLTSVVLRRRDKGDIVLQVGCTDYTLLNVHFGMLDFKYVQIRTDTYEYVQNTYEYVRIRTNTCSQSDVTGQVGKNIVVEYIQIRTHIVFNI